MANYEYQTIYGIEPYKPNGVPVSDNFGGGAEETNDNLLITLWNLPGYIGGNPTSGQLMKPFASTGAGAEAIAGAKTGGVDIAKGFDKVFKSRYSSRFYVRDVNLGTQDDPVYQLTNGLLAILKMPQDMANDWLTYAKLPISDTNVDFQKSFFYPLAWDFLSTFTTFQLQTEVAFFGGFFSTGGSFAMCKTNGANGVFPEFYPASQAGVVQMLQDLAAGKELFIPCIFSRNATFQTENAELFTFSWPGSNARR